MGGFYTIAGGFRCGRWVEPERRLRQDFPCDGSAGNERRQLFDLSFPTIEIVPPCSCRRGLLSFLIPAWTRPEGEAGRPWNSGWTSEPGASQQRRPLQPATRRGRPPSTTSSCALHWEITNEQKG